MILLYAFFPSLYEYKEVYLCRKQTVSPYHIKYVQSSIP